MISKDTILRKTFLATAICMILESLAQSIGETVDGIVIGRGLGQDAMAAFGVCTPVITICSVIGMVLAVGARTAFSEHLGAGRIEAAQKTFALPFYLTMAFSFLFAVIAAVFAAPITRLMGARGNAAISAYSVFRNIDGLFNPFTIGMADAAVVIADVLYSEQNKPALRRLFNVVMKWTLIIQTSVAVLGYIAAPWLAGLFMKGSAEAFSLSVDAVHAYMFSIPLYGAVFLYRNYLTGIGKAALATVSALMMEFALVIAAAWSLVGIMGAPAAWYSLAVSQAAMLLFYAGMIAVVNRREKAMANCPLTDRILFLPASFDVPEEDRLDLTASSLEEVMAFKNAILEFCNRHHCDQKRQLALGLCAEELGANTVEYGFRPGKENCIDMRIIKQEDDYLLRLRDNCARFDPARQYELLSEDDKMSHIGIRLAFGMAKKIEYVTHLDLNNLTIRV